MGVALVAQRGYTYARAKEATGVPTGTIHRAVKAKEQHRKAGRNGRPPKINEEATAALIDEIRQANLQSPTFRWSCSSESGERTDQGAPPCIWRGARRRGA